ncbi:nuclease-related domain-containing protein [Pseudenterobacter timonensis]|uniref:nuclease-related domain-containing protein n=1 Tax=Pseudenterobacter timonensis TaxID=1755099 RepID=UPI00077B7F1F|nr:nuclease-related domain-containing protein [Pseudenterobacter timonensis]
MDTLLTLWRVVVTGIMLLILIVLYCLLDLQSSAINEGRTVKKIKAGLPDDAEGLLSDLTLPVHKRGTTQIDHVLIASHGLYVIEQKDYVGALYGTLEDSHWRKWTHVRSLRLQNPFRQNYGHIKAIQETLKAADIQCINVVIINGPCKFKGEKPDWLCMGTDEFIHKVKERRGMNVIHPECVRHIHAELKSKRKSPGLYTDLHHIHHVTTKYKKPMPFAQSVTYRALKFIRYIWHTMFLKVK